MSSGTSLLGHFFLLQECHRGHCKHRDHSRGMAGRWQSCRQWVGRQGCWVGGSGILPAYCHTAPQINQNLTLLLEQWRGSGQGQVLRTRCPPVQDEDTGRRWPSANQGERPQKKPTLPTASSRLSSLQNCWKTHFCCLNLPVPGTLLQKA